MVEKKKVRQETLCPSCGRRISSGFLSAKNREIVKVIFVVLVLLYVVASTFLLIMSTPPGMRKIEGTLPYDSWLQPLSQEPAFYVITGGGFAIGFVVVYWEGLQAMRKWRQVRHGKTMEKKKVLHKRKCRHCGGEWDE